VRRGKGGLKKAEEELRQLQESIAKGYVKSRKHRDENIGYILKNYAVKRYLHIKRKRSGLQFEVERTEALDEENQYDGYQIFVTTEMDLTEREIIDSYRIRDQIEKAIRILKNVLGLHPQYVRTKEHVLGNIFICATAFQLRSILRMKLKDRGIDMSIEEAMRTLERLKAVNITIGQEGEIQVYRKLSALDGKTRTLIEVFNMAENEKLPEVETEKFK
jgi:transposase